ncbi:hypothetical protein J1605_008137 [Eschrichtius robustus]|uniref:Uncharacterized protein n=1 Tax=Eschrichtius robustus TaxID=9764 RepID=A0AB34H1C5_ESCRO|nr:hypothetical protein J1605_008137 [Eschrichtius robustus]
MKVKVLILLGSSRLALGAAVRKVPAFFTAPGEGLLGDRPPSSLLSIHHCLYQVENDFILYGYSVGAARRSLSSDGASSAEMLPSVPAKRGFYPSEYLPSLRRFNRQHPDKNAPSLDNGPASRFSPSPSSPGSQPEPA